MHVFMTHHHHNYDDGLAAALRVAYLAGATTAGWRAAALR